MRPKLLIALLMVISGMSLFSQNNSTLKFIFVSHPRTEDNVNESVLPGIEKIDFTKYNVKMIGGDITNSTSKNRASLSYCDNLFDLKNPNTLWCFGNHDVQSGNRALIKEFTGRDSYYSYCRDRVTFIVLDTELDANGFSRTFIKGDQLQLVKNVCDTISVSKYLILLHSRFMWMINNEYFKTKLTDSIAASTRSMDTTNFYSDIYPLLQKVKAKGIPVKVLGGDKSKINITWSPEDSITFYTATMSPDLPDSVNNVMILNYNLQNKTINCNYVTLADIEKKTQDTLLIKNYYDKEDVLKVWQTSGLKEINVQLQTRNNDHVVLQIFSINGAISQSIKCNGNEIQSILLNKPGIYFAKAFVGNSVLIKKFVFN
jgi:hypothetical protein